MLDNRISRIVNYIKYSDVGQMGLGELSYEARIKSSQIRSRDT